MAKACPDPRAARLRLADRETPSLTDLRTFARTLGATLMLAALPLAALTSAAQAEEWPTKPVKLMYNYPAGNGGDTVTRYVAEMLSKKFGQAFVVENRPGAAGAVGVETMTKSAPDGYTFLTTPNAPLVLLPLLRKVPYDPNDLVPVAALGEYVYAWSVLPTLGPKNMAELVALAKSKPGQLTYGTPGAGSATNLRGETWNKMAGIEVVHVPYRGGSEAIIDLLGGRLDIMIDYATFPHAKAGKVLLLAMTTSRRHPDFPDVPTIKEAGYDIGLPTFLSLYGIKGTPPDIVKKMGDAMKEITATPEYEERLLQIGFFAMKQTGPEVVALTTDSAKDFKTWVEKTGLKIE
jgi:tripartite-type tricarboxylate transporter receptor subunit TctC